MRLSAGILPLLCFPLALAVPQKRQVESGDKYLLGVGKADVTGPVVELGFMGYANLDQVGTGLRQRIYSRAFIVGNVNKNDERFVYVIADLACGDTAIRDGVLKKLTEKYGSLYKQANVALVGTHSHSGPGAWLNYLLPQITTKGFDSQSYSAIVEGIVRSITRAHDSAAPGYLSLSKGMVEDANINRSPYSYDNNPADERARYTDVGGNVDKVMTVLTFKNEAGSPIGLLNWFPTHGTSMYGNNTLVTGDNKGAAAIQMEKDIGNGFVAGFSQANVGDTSPNTLGPICQDTGLPCKYEDSTCNGKAQQCMGRGPGFRTSDTESCRIIGEKQYLGAKSIFSSSQTPVSGDGGIVRSLHSFVDFGAGYKFKLANGTEKQTCKAALGFSFAGGTTDGPGFADFVQNDPGKPSNPFWLIVRGFLKTPTAEQKKCHEPKPILLDVGEMDKPYDWSPNIVDIQMLRVGQLSIIVSPGEATTMAGRRWREAVKDELDKRNIVPKEKSWEVIGGPANTYTHYISTPEEYEIQRYEGASTMYGMYTLNAYIDLARKFTPYLAATPPATPLPPGPAPPIYTNSSISLITGVVYDGVVGRKFGDVITDVSAASYRIGETATVKFAGANPRNNLRLEGTFAAVEKKDGNGNTWTRVRDDSDWNLVYRWKRTEGISGQSEVTISWTVEGGTEKGTYRIRYYGDAKMFLSGRIQAFEGVSGTFTVG